MKKQTIITILVVLVVILIAALGYQHYVGKKTTPAEDTAPGITTPATNEPITITEKEIREPNYTGTKPVVAGSGALAAAARKYIDDSIADFAKAANEEVPERRKEYGEGEPATNYGIDMGAKTLESATTQSVVIDSYVYTGGANGSSMYKVFTATKAGKLLTIRDIVKPTMQQAFVSLVQKDLTTRKDSLTYGVVFTEDVQKLTIDSLSNFSIDGKNLTLYFDKYQIGPGALGAVEFPIPLSRLQTYITLPQ